MVQGLGGSAFEYDNYTGGTNVSVRGTRLEPSLISC
jgi:hypothetical protein